MFQEWTLESNVAVIS